MLSNEPEQFSLQYFRRYLHCLQHVTKVCPVVLCKRLHTEFGETALRLFPKRTVTFREIR